MTLDLKELKRLADAATDGPWDAYISTHPKGYADLYLKSDGNKEIFATSADMDFIAASRTAIPELIAEVERLREALNFYAYRQGDNGHNARQALENKND